MSKYSIPYFRLKYVEDAENKTFDLNDEPLNWDKVQIILDRDLNYFGVNYQYTDGDINLEFTSDLGFEEISRLFDTYGTDYEIIFEFGLRDGLVETMQFEGRLNLNTNIKTSKNTISCTIETAGLHIKINSRLDVKVDLFSDETIDGNAMPEENSIDVELHSKGIKRRFICDNDAYEDTGFEGPWGDLPVNWYFTFNTQENLLSEIEEFQGTLNETWENLPYTTDTKIPVWKIKEPGTYRFKIKAYFETNGYLMYNGCIIESGVVDELNIAVKILVEHSNGSLADPVTLYTKTWNNGDQDNTFLGTHQFDEEVELQFQAFDNVYIYGHVWFATSGCRGDIMTRIGTHQFKMDVIAITQLDSSISKAFLLHESAQRILNSITGVEDIFYSELLGREDLGYEEDGNHSKYINLNGFLIRNFIENGVPLRKLGISFKEYIESLSSIFCIGIGYEYFEGIKKVRIEDISHFFQEKQIIFITENSEYTEEVAKEFIYNEIEIGYSKFPSEGEYMLDEFNTKHQYTTPIQTNKQKLPKLSPFIASGYAIEFLRRLQFEVDPVDSNENDNDNFIIAVTKDGDDWKSEKNENFTVMEDTLFSPETAYNLRISPKRNLLRWAKWINGCLIWKDSTEKIKNTLYENNGDLETLMNGIEIDYIKEKSDVPLYNFDGRNRFNMPIWINFKTRLSYEQMIQIVNSFNGLDLDKQNGFITTISNKKQLVAGWLYRLTYSPAKQEATFKLLKSDLLTNNLSCADYASWTIGDFEINEYPEWVENCTFGNFD